MLSKAALTRFVLILLYLFNRATCSFVEQGLHNSSICRQDNGGSEDVEMGKKKIIKIFNKLFFLKIQESVWTSYM